jgi:hypothetical protein
MRTLCCALSLVTMVALAGAQEKQIPQNVLEDIARDLAVLQSEVIKTGEEQRAELALSYKHPVAVNINKPADVRTGADKNADVSFKVSPGTTLPVVDKVNDCKRLGCNSSDYTAASKRRRKILPKFN